MAQCFNFLDGIIINLWQDDFVTAENVIQHFYSLPLFLSSSPNRRSTTQPNTSIVQTIKARRKHYIVHIRITAQADKYHITLGYHKYPFVAKNIQTRPREYFVYHGDFPCFLGGDWVLTFMHVWTAFCKDLLASGQAHEYGGSMGVALSDRWGDLMWVWSYRYNIYVSAVEEERDADDWWVGSTKYDIRYSIWIRCQKLIPLNLWTVKHLSTLRCQTHLRLSTSSPGWNRNLTLNPDVDDVDLDVNIRTSLTLTLTSLTHSMVSTSKYYLGLVYWVHT